MASIVSVSGVSKFVREHFWTKKRCILSNINIDIQEKEVLGIIGHNGAGKTTILKMLVGLLTPDSGSIYFGEQLGKNPSLNMGFLPETPYFYKYLTAHEALTFYSTLFGDSGLSAPQITTALFRVGLHKRSHTQILSSYSKGMLQRFGFAQALINDPYLLLLDEPMSGLDPKGRKDIRDLIYGLKEEGKTIIFCSHILDDVERLCDRVVLFHRGRIKSIVSMKEVSDSSQWLLEYISYDSNLCAKSAIDQIRASSVTDLNLALQRILDNKGKIINVEKMAPPLESWIEQQ